MNKRVTQFIFISFFIICQSSLYAAEKYEFVKMWPEKESGNTTNNHGRFIGGPNEIFITLADYIFVFDQVKTEDFEGSTRIQQFSPKGNYISKWIDENSGYSHLYHSDRSLVLTIDSKGILYCIGRTHQDGKHWMGVESQISLIPLVPAPVSYPEVPLPHGFVIELMGIDSKDNIILLGSSIENVSEYGGTQQVGVEDMGNTDFLLKIDRKGEIIWKTDISKEVSHVSSLISDKTGNIYFVNYIVDGKEILKYSKDGILLKSIDCKVSTKSIGSIAVDNKGNIYATDDENNCVVKLDVEGNEITRWGQAGLGKGEFNHPTGIGVDSKGNVYVADTDNHRVQKFAPVH